MDQVNRRVCPTANDGTTQTPGLPSVLWQPPSAGEFTAVTAVPSGGTAVTVTPVATSGPLLTTVTPNSLAAPPTAKVGLRPPSKLPTAIETSADCAHTDAASTIAADNNHLNETLHM